ncbi:hypothetical protein V6N13_077571 [Hibiscus sabdariffa]
MHSLSLKFFTDLNSRATTNTCIPARLGHGLAIDLDFVRRRRVGPGCWDRGCSGRKCWVVGCAVDRNGNGGNPGGGERPSLDPDPTRNQGLFLSRSQTFAMLKQQMEAAAKSEEGDFEMKHIDRVGSTTFNVVIAPFSLSTLGEDADTF